MTKIKMCGLRRMEDIAFVNKLLPQYIGYVFAESSRRYIEPEKAAELTRALDKRICPVGVFVNADTDLITQLYEAGTIKMAQLHGDENDDIIAALQNKGIPVIKALVIKNASDIGKAERSPADYVLLDSGKGSGITFDHSLIGGIKRPYFLAGGLTPENVGEAVRKLSPYAVDASSCLETGGFKDLDKMLAFSKAVNQIQ